MTHIEVVDKILTELGAGGKPTIAVLNKSDAAEGKIIPSKIEQYTETVCISAKEGIGIERLMETVENVAPGKKQEVSLCLPYSETKYVSELHENQVVLEEEYTADGIQLRALVDAICYDKLRRYITR